MSTGRMAAPAKPAHRMNSIDLHNSTPNPAFLRCTPEQQRIVVARLDFRFGPDSDIAMMLGLAPATVVAS